jgi:sulfur-oxidizing protein SoxZ
VTRALINVPKQARRGEIIEIKAMVAHVMETGHRRDAQGALVPRNIIHRFTCHYDDVEIFAADLFRRSRPIPTWPSARSPPEAAR